MRGDKFADTLPHLTALFQVFFQDWVDEFSDGIAALRGSMLEQPPIYLQAALREIDHVLDTVMADADLEILLNYYYPPGEGRTYRAWLGVVRLLLAEETTLKAFFMMPDEIPDILRKVRRAEHLTLIRGYRVPRQYPIRVEVLEPLEEDVERGSAPDVLYVSAAPPPVDDGGHVLDEYGDLSALRTLAAEQGWVSLVPGEIEDGLLTQSTLSFISPRPAARLLFNRLETVLAERMTPGIHFAGPTGEGDCPNILSSPGARESFSQGITWIYRREALTAKSSRIDRIWCRPVSWLTQHSPSQRPMLGDGSHG